MKRFGLALIISVTLALLGCGGGSTIPADTLKGTWTAGLMNSDGTLALGFTVAMTQSGQTVEVTKVDFLPSSSCFAPGMTALASLNSVTTTHGVTSGSFQMTIQSGPSNVNGDNTLILQGSMVRTNISGSWSLTGTGIQCSDTLKSMSGDFSMLQQVPPTN